MSITGFTPGITTLTAKTDLEKYRLVRISVGSLTDPPEVEYTDNTVISGVTESSVKAGELVGVRPLNSDGTFQLEVLLNTAISFGTDIYVATDGTGRVTDEDTAFFLGQSLGEVSQTGQIIEVGGTSSGGVVVTDAASVTIADTGDYYTSTNVEGALQEIGAAIANRPVSEMLIGSQLINYRTSAPYPETKANVGGILASDSPRVLLVNDNVSLDGVFMARLNIGTGSTLAHLGGLFSPFYPINLDAASSVKIQYQLPDGTYSISGNFTVIDSIGSGTTYLIQNQTLPVTGVPFGTHTLISFTGGAFPEGISLVDISLTIQNTTDPITPRLDILNLTFNYLTPQLG